MQGQVFSPIITREFRPPKPDPAGILHIAKDWGLEGRGGRLIMVGDSIDDITAGRKAGAATVLLANDGNRNLEGHENTDCVVEKCVTRRGLLLKHANLRVLAWRI
jgi:phosphoglycolate phosphatase-like HAD superfamily hydrolase